MTSAETRALLNRWFQEVWNEGKEPTIHELFHPEGKAHGWPEPSSVLKGPEEFAKVFRMFQSAFSDIQMTVHDVIAEGERGAIRWSCTMKHTGGDLGIPATGNTVTLPGASFILCKDGKLIDGWNYLDQTCVMHELHAAAASKKGITGAIAGAVRSLGADPF